MQGPQGRLLSRPWTVALLLLPFIPPLLVRLLLLPELLLLLLQLQLPQPKPLFLPLQLQPLRPLP